MSPMPDPDPFGPDDVLTNRGIALMRLGLLPIALVELSQPQNDLSVDLYPFLVGILAVYAITLLVLSFRRDAPILSPITQVLIDLLLIAGLVYTSGGATSPLRFAFYVLPILAAIRLSPRLAVVSTGLALLAYLLVTIPHPSTRRPADLHLVLQESLTLIWVGAAAAMLSALVGRRARQFAELAANRRELVQQSLDAEARERRRLAQVLHDGAIQNVLLARQEVTDLERGVPAAGKRAKAALDETHRQLRDEVFAMHPVGLERAGSEAVLRHFADDASRRGNLQARVQVQPAVADARDDLLYASAREVLTNVVKHANATQVDIDLGGSAALLELRITDDGAGFAPERLEQALAGGHIGLASVEERLRAVGGELRIDSQPGRGTTVTVMIPRPA